VSSARRLLAQITGSIAGAIAVASALAADVEAGRAKAQTCAACHGEGGNSANPAVPSLARQPALFTMYQLMMFRDGRRKDPQMSPVAANLTDRDLEDLGAYFAAQKVVAPAFTGDPAKAEAGSQAARGYHCLSCHGANLMGSDQIPRIASQHYQYLRTQLRLYKARTRSDLEGQMTSSAQALSDEDIENLAQFAAGFPPP
jgi:cytochrome c553